MKDERSPERPLLIWQTKRRHAPKTPLSLQKQRVQHFCLRNEIRIGFIKLQSRRSFSRLSTAALVISVQINHVPFLNFIPSKSEY